MTTALAMVGVLAGYAGLAWFAARVIGRRMDREREE